MLYLQILLPSLYILHLANVLRNASKLFIFSNDQLAMVVQNIKTGKKSMSQISKNRLSVDVIPTEPRVMLAASFADSDTVSHQAHSAGDARIAANFGNIEVVVAGDRTYAIVPTRASELPPGETAAPELEEALEELYGETSQDAFDAALSEDSDAGTAITQNELDRLENQVLRALADEIGAAAYVGETGSGTLSRINSGVLPSVRRKGSTDDLLNLGFETTRFGSAENASQLPNILTYNDAVQRSIGRVRDRARRIDVEVGTVINLNGRVSSEVGLVDGDENAVVLPTADEIDNLINVGGVVVHAHSSVRFDQADLAFGERRFV